MKISYISNLIKIFIILSFFIPFSVLSEKIRVDEVPMYGGMDRTKYKSLRKGDKKFIDGVTKKFGSRENASQIWVETGFSYYQNNQLEMAMRRFNQAWLLNPENPEVYVGFASVLHDQGKHCEAKDFMNKSLELNPPLNQGIYADAARVTALCALSENKSSESENKILLEESEQLFKKSEEIEPNKQYLYGLWASSYYWQGRYIEAWEMIQKQRENGGEPSPHFLSLLKEKEPNPNILKSNKQ